MTVITFWTIQYTFRLMQSMNSRIVLEIANAYKILDTQQLKFWARHKLKFH